MSRAILALILFLLSSSASAAPTSVRGAAVIFEVSEGIDLTVPGRESSQKLPEAYPIYIPGLFSAASENADSIYLLTSNKVDLLFQGPGFFGLERYESNLAPADTASGPFAESQSRMILNLRRGTLAVDSGQLDVDSKLILETPFGRISGARAKWFIQLEFDLRSGIYDFTIACEEGQVRLTDLRNESYIIYAGQRLAGAGSYSAPAIEVGELTDLNRERFGRFAALLTEYDTSDIDYVALREQMIAVQLSAAAGNAATSGRTATDKRPIIIEFAPRAPELTPFRGEMPPPSEIQTDTF